MVTIRYIKLRLPKEKMEFREDGGIKTATFKRMETNLDGANNYDLNLIMHALSKWGTGGYDALYDSVDYQLCDVEGFELFAKGKFTPAPPSPPSQYYLHVSPSEVMWLTSDDIIYEVTSNTEWEIE